MNYNIHQVHVVHIKGKYMNEIAYFKDWTPQDGIHFYKQLRDKIREFIENHHDNTSFPAERDLSNLFGLNRRTVRKAIEPFVNEGLLVRNSKGTVIRKISQNTKNFYPEIHPLAAEDIYDYPSKSRLCFTLFENLPGQRTFWNNAVKIFNHKNPNVNIELDWLPLNIANAEEYIEYFKLHKSDIIQTPNSWEKTIKVKNFLTPLPNDIKKEAEDDKYWIKFLLESMHEKIDCVLPVHWGFPVFAWNCELTSQAGIPNVCDIISKKGIRQLFIEAEKAMINDGVFLTGHTADYTMDFGFPAYYDEKCIENFYKEKFIKIAELPPTANKWFQQDINTACYSKSHSIKLFKDSRIVFSMASISELHNFPAGKDFKYQCVLPSVKNEEKLVAGFSGLGVLKESKAKDIAWDFLRFLLSDEIQDLIPIQIRNISMRKKSNSKLHDIIPLSYETLNERISGVRIITGFDVWLGEISAEARHDFFPGIFNGIISVEDALDKTMRRVKEKFNQGIVNSQNHRGGGRRCASSPVIPRMLASRIG